MRNREREREIGKCTNASLQRRKYEQLPEHLTARLAALSPSFHRASDCSEAPRNVGIVFVSGSNQFQFLRARDE